MTYGLTGVDFKVFSLMARQWAGKTTGVEILTMLLKKAAENSVNGLDVGSKPDNVRQAITLKGKLTELIIHPDVFSHLSIKK